jgi:transcriptional regulator with XRE-family HTH domain
MKIVELIPAARALLKWTQQELADASGLALGTIANLEAQRRTAEVDTIEKIVSALNLAGVEFIPGGVRKASAVYYYDGPGWYIDLLADALNTVQGTDREILIENVDDIKSSPAVLNFMKGMKDQGVTFRMTAMEGNTHLAAPSSCYRFIPGPFFENWIVMIFGDKVAVSLAEESRCMVIKDADLARALRNRFNLLWHVLPELKIESTADARI